MNSPTSNPPVRASLYPHQVEGWQRAVDTMINHGGGYGLLYEMGCGKTLTAIAVVGTLYRRRMIRRLLVIAAEDIGLAYPQAIVVTKACVDAALAATVPAGQGRRMIERVEIIRT